MVSGASGDAVIIDPGGEASRISAHVAERALRVHAILNTHAHWDHLGAAVALVEEYGAPFLLHPADERLLRRANIFSVVSAAIEPVPIPAIDAPLADAMTLRFADLEIDVLHTPGHTPGSVCFEVQGDLFTGDTVLADHLGRTDLPGGERKTLERSLALLEERYPPEMRLRPGHGEPALLGAVVPRLAVLPEFRG